MTFVQIVSITTDHIEQVYPLAEEWKAQTEGRRTLLRDQAFVDRSDPRRHVLVTEFESYEQAMVNSDLPETAAMAERLTALAHGPVEFTDLEEVFEYDIRRELAALLRQSLETSTIPAGLYTDDVTFEGLFPDQVHRRSGAAAIHEVLVEEAPGRELDRWDITTTGSGFAGEYCYRTTGTSPSYLSLGTILATVTGGRISRLVVTCAGAWDRAAEDRILGAMAS